MALWWKGRDVRRREFPFGLLSYLRRVLVAQSCSCCTGYREPHHASHPQRLLTRVFVLISASLADPIPACPKPLYPALSPIHLYISLPLSSFLLTNSSIRRKRIRDQRLRRPLPNFLPPPHPALPRRHPRWQSLRSHRVHVCRQEKGGEEEVCCQRRRRRAL
jgi:hypothetical protein